MNRPSAARKLAIVHGPSFGAARSASDISRADVTGRFNALGYYEAPPAPTYMWDKAQSIVKGVNDAINTYQGQITNKAQVGARLWVAMVDYAVSRAQTYYMQTGTPVVQ
jgi:hypothetical protein